MLKARKTGFLIVALIGVGVSVAHLRIVPGEWRMSAYTPAGVLHYSACLRGRHFASQVLSHEGQHCRLSGPIKVEGAAMTVHEECQIPGPGGRGSVRAHLVAHVVVQRLGLRFTGRSRITISTSLGDISEHQRLSGVRTGPCTSR